MLKAKLNRKILLALGLNAVVLAEALAEGASPVPAPTVADKPAEAPKGWQSVASVGLSLTRGNSENFLATVGFTSARKWPQDEALLGVNAGYGGTTIKKPGEPQQESTTDEYAKGYAQWNHLFDHRLYAGLRLDAIYDRIAGIDYRFIVSPLAGYYFVKTPKTFLALETGPSFVAEELKDKPPKQYMGIRVGERFEHKFSERAKIWQTAEWVPQVDQFENWILNAEAGVSSAISKALDLRLVLLDSYNNRPSPGREKNDLKIIAALAYKF